MRRVSLTALAVAALACAACTPGPRPGTSEPLARAVEAGFQRARVQAGDFVLTVLHRQRTAAPLLVVYVEGDGRAFLGRRRVSADPTPADPLALRLALRDERDAVAWIARPCQYLERPERDACPPRYWTTARYSEAVITAVDAAVEQMRVRTGAARVGLVGFSGGGTVAALVAARRTDVAWLVTVAANLDHAAWTRLHRVTPLSASLSPVDHSERLRRVTQRHLVGSADRIVPLAVTEAYLAALGHPDTSAVRVLDGFDHRCCWERVWPELLHEVLR